MLIIARTIPTEGLDTDNVPEGHEFVWITQMDAAGNNDRDIADVCWPTTAWMGWAQIFHAVARQALAPHVVLLSRRLPNGDLADDDPICLTAPQAQAFMYGAGLEQLAEHLTGAGEMPV